MIHKRTLDAKEKYEGAVFKTNNYGDVEVTEYIDSHNITVKFLNTGNVRKTGTSELKKGEIRDNEAFPVYKVGVMDIPNELRRGQPAPKEYSIWNGIRQRCYNENIRSINPTYKNVEMSDNFKLYSYFKDWCGSQIGFDQEGWELDKDLLSKGCKIYSEDTCVFVPAEINCALPSSKKVRGSFPQGVIYNCTKTRYRARIQRGDEWESLGTYDTSEEAFYAYKPVKESHIKSLSEKWKDKIDTRVYEALMNWTIEITD